MFKRIIGIVFLCLLIASLYGFAAETPPIKKEASEIETGKLVTSRPITFCFNGGPGHWDRP